MRLQIKALAISLAVGWGGLVFLAGLAHLIWPGYAAAFWELVASIYPGVGAIGLVSLAMATLYALIDGMICGVIIAWLYNAAARPATAS